MEVRICKACGIEKSLGEFHKEKTCVGGRQTQCKTCLNARRKLKYYQNHAHEKACDAAYRAANPEKIKEQSRAWNSRNKEHRRSYKEANKEKIAAKNAEYFQRVKERRAELAREKYRNDPLHAMKCRLRLRTRLAIKAKGFTKKSRIRQILGCDDITLKSHIQALFTEGMTWENRGEWHLDHKTPLAAANNEEELLALCHYKNLQPLWAADNFAKGGRIAQGEPA
jgi:hypothetical protein